VQLAAAADFRIHTKVYSGDRLEPDSQNTTLFRGGLVYDFLSEPRKVTIYDKARARFVILDPARQVQTDVSVDEVQKLNKQIAAWAAERKDDLLNSLANPSFTQKQDPNTGAMLFSNAALTYAVKSSPAENKELFDQYDEFADLFVQLNNMLSLPVRPPYGLARLAVNHELRKKGEIPTEVQLTVHGVNKLPLLNKNLVLRSQHQMTPMLSQSDQRDIEAAQRQLATFKRVPFDEFMPPATAAQRPGTNQR
jgi:hypothetical protein